MIRTKTTQVAARANMKAMGEYEYHKNEASDRTAGLNAMLNRKKEKTVHTYFQGKEKKRFTKSR